jgi:hypothetical protein
LDQLGHAVCSVNVISSAPEWSPSRGDLPYTGFKVRGSSVPLPFPPVCRMPQLFVD